MPLPVLKVTVNEIFFRFCDNSFQNIFDEVFPLFKEGQAAGNLEQCINKINEIFGNDHMKFQIFVSQLSSFLVHNTIKTEKNKVNVVSKIDIAKKLTEAQQNYRKAYRSLIQEQEMQAEIYSSGTIGWYKNWKLARIAAKITHLEEMKNASNIEICGLLTINGGTISHTLDTWKEETENNKKCVNFLNLLSNMTEQKMLECTAPDGNTSDADKSLLLQSCVCVQVAKKIAVQNYVESATQFNKSVALVNSKKYLFAGEGDYHDMEKANVKVANENDSERNKKSAAIVVAQPKSTKILVVIGTTIKQVIEKIKNSSYNSTRSLEHPSHANSATLAANAETLVDYMNGVEHKHVAHVDKQLEADLLHDSLI